VPALVNAETDVEPAALVRAAQGGDRAAFGTLYERYARMVHGILLAHVSPDDVDDLMQDVFMRALEQLSSLKDGSAFGGWLATIARRAAADLHRRRKNMAIETDLGGGSRPDGEAFAILDSMHRLPEAYRETLVLRLVEGMTGPEIAERTGLTPASVRVNLCRGMCLLREMVGGHPKL
jgi:RNA polymerase sigma-70 factor (ECF subfamily)